MNEWIFSFSAINLSSMHFPKKGQCEMYVEKPVSQQLSLYWLKLLHVFVCVNASVGNLRILFWPSLKCIKSKFNFLNMIDGGDFKRVYNNAFGQWDWQSQDFIV